jgi:hypothetical protein
MNEVLLLLIRSCADYREFQLFLTVQRIGAHDGSIVYSFHFNHPFQIDLSSRRFAVCCSLNSVFDIQF